MSSGFKCLKKIKKMIKYEILDKDTINSDKYLYCRSKKKFITLTFFDSL